MGHIKKPLIYIYDEQQSKHRKSDYREQVLR